MPAPVVYNLDDRWIGISKEAARSYFLLQGDSFCAKAMLWSSWSVAKRVSCRAWWHLGDIRFALLTPGRGGRSREQGLRGWERMGREFGRKLGVSRG